MISKANINRNCPDEGTILTSLSAVQAASLVLSGQTLPFYAKGQVHLQEKFFQLIQLNPGSLLVITAGAGKFFYTGTIFHLNLINFTVKFSAERSGGSASQGKTGIFKAFSFEIFTGK